MVTGSDIAQQARSWLGTRFHHQGRLKHNANDAGGCDCLGLLVGVAEELQLHAEGTPVMAFDERDYGHYPDGVRMREVLERLFSLVSLE